MRHAGEEGVGRLVDRRAAGEGRGADVPTESFGCFEQGDLDAVDGAQRMRRGEPGDPAADDEDSRHLSTASGGVQATGELAHHRRVVVHARCAGERQPA